MPGELVYAPGHERSRSLGWLASAWIEHWAIHGPGDVQGDSVALDDEFAGFVLDTYALNRAGRRLYSRTALVRPKGRAKSELAGFIGLFEARGPSRFAGWAEVVKRSVGGASLTSTPRASRWAVRSLTPTSVAWLRKRAQTGNTYDVIHYNLSQGALGEDPPGDAAGLTRILLPEGAEIIPSTASSSAKDGGKESLAIYDEPHLYITPELRRMFKTVDRNLRKRKAAEP